MVGVQVGDDDRVEFLGGHVLLQPVERAGAEVEAHHAARGSHEVAALGLTGSRVRGAHPDGHERE